MSNHIERDELSSAIPGQSPSVISRTTTTEEKQPKTFHLHELKETKITKSPASPSSVEEQKITHVTGFKSFWFFINSTFDRKIRKPLLRIVKSKYFEFVVLLIIFVNCIFLALDTPDNPANLR